MAVFISGGHDLNNSGASAHGYKEELEMIRFRDKVVQKYKSLYPGSIVITDGNTESLKDYLKRIKTGNGSTVVEFHLDAFSNQTISGISGWVGDDADKMDIAFAKEFCKEGAAIMGVPNRGIFKENQSFHKKLGLMRESGIVCLIEIVPITNKSDMKAFQKSIDELSIAFARIIKKYEDMIV